MALLVAVVSAVLGAVLAGAAQRSERRSARAAAEQLDHDFKEARKLIATHLKHDTWWSEPSQPSTEVWDLYQQALIAQQGASSGTLRRVQALLPAVHARGRAGGYPAQGGPQNGSDRLRRGHAWGGVR